MPELILTLIIVGGLTFLGVLHIFRRSRPFHVEVRVNDRILTYQEFKVVRGKVTLNTPPPKDALVRIHYFYHEDTL